MQSIVVQDTAVMSATPPKDSIEAFLDASQQEATMKSRSPRFPIQTSLRFREKGEAEWSEGTTVNISRTGVLFQTDEKMEPETILEMQIVFPASMTAGAAAHIISWGPVTRTEAPRVAAAFRHHRFTSMSAE
jgi:hypothetical protein